MELFNNLPDSFFTSIDNICISLLLGVLGIAITIFTVVYSFMESNKQAIRKLTDEIRYSEEIDPVKTSDLRFANEYMKRMKNMNRALMAIIFIDVSLFIFFCIYLSFNSSTLRFIAYALVTLLMVGCMITLSVYLKQYISRFKNV